MATTYLNEQDIKDVIRGAAVFGAGGGGSPSNGYDMLQDFIDQNPGTTVQVTLIDPSDMVAGEYACVVAGMGSPDAIIGINFTPYVVNTYNLLADMASTELNRTLSYTMPVELGGFNTFVPMLISLQENLPFVNADGCGRAVPALTTLLFAINGLDTSPLAMANDASPNGDHVRINLADPKDAQTAEDIGRYISVAFGNRSGLAGWMVTSSDITSALPTGTILMSRDVGAILRNAATAGTLTTVYEQINAAGITTARTLANGTCTRKDTVAGPGGFDLGIVEITDDTSGQVWQIMYQNENLVLYRGNDDATKVPYMTVPDIIATYDTTTGDSLTNADLELNQKISLGIMKVNERWWDVGEAAQNAIWQPFFSNAGYTGSIIRYENTPS